MGGSGDAPFEALIPGGKQVLCERERECVCVCVVRERVCVCARERECVCVFLCVLYVLRSGTRDAKPEPKP